MSGDPTRKLKIFKEEASEHLAKIREAIKVVDAQPHSSAPLKEMHRSAHTIKGIAALLDFKNISETALQLELIFEKIQEGGATFAGGVKAEVEELNRLLAAQLEKVEGRITSITKAENAAVRSLKPKSVLLVEDDSLTAELIADLLESNESFALDIHTAVNLEEAKQLLQVKNFSLILLDLTLPDSVGLATLSGIQEVNQGVPIVIMTGYQEEVVAKFKGGDVREILIKGSLDAEKIHEMIAGILKR